MEDKYLVGEYDNQVFIKIVGNATMKNSRTLDDLLNKLFEGSKKDIIIDFKECNYMDSTMLGVIAKNAVKIRKLWGTSLYAIKLSNMARTNLSSTGVHRLLSVIDEDSDNVNMQEIEKKDFDNKMDKTLHILEAHKTLMELNDDNKQVFKNVVSLLEKEINK